MLSLCDTTDQVDSFIRKHLMRSAMGVCYRRPSHEQCELTSMMAIPVLQLRGRMLFRKILCPPGLGSGQDMSSGTYLKHAKQLYRRYERVFLDAMQDTQ